MCKLKLWVVTEGMAGTENQCLAIADTLGLPYDIKRIGLRFPYNLISPHLVKAAPSWAIRGIDWAEGAPDIVIGSGRKAVPVLLAIKRHSPQVYAVYVQNPKINPDYFDMVIAPMHDGLAGENVVQTIAAPNRITPAGLEAAKARFDYSALPQTKIAVLIGGNSKAHKIPHDFVLRLQHQLQPYLESPDYGFMVTVSRRTPDPLRHQLQQVFTGERCRFWNGEGDNPYHAYLAWADYILVTEDSTSMLSDALTTGKPAYRLRLEGGSEKFNRLYKVLADKTGLDVFDGQFAPRSYAPLRDAVIPELQKIVQNKLDTKEKL